MRRRRELLENATYHIVTRTNRKEMIFDTMEIRTLFLQILAKAKKRYRFTIENFCIMGNHIHLMIKPKQRTDLSRIMQWLLSVFAQTYNRMKKLTGHVWGDRFFSRAIKNLREYVTVFSYINDNPVKAGLVERSEDWPCCGSSFRIRSVRTILDPLCGADGLPL